MLTVMVGRMRLGASVLGSAALVAALALPATAADAPPGLPPDGAAVATLGDSYASGEGAPAPGAQPWSADVFGDSGANGCHRSVVGGHALFGQVVAALSGTQYVNAACSGATTAGLVTGSKGEPSQLAALGPETGLVTLSIGGNDAGFSTVAAACNTVVPVPGLPTCSAALAASAGALQALTTAGPDGVSPLQALHGTVQAQAPNALVLVTGYPLLFPAVPSEACSAIAPEAQTVINAATVQLNAAIAASAEAVGATYVDLVEPFVGHSSCEADPARSWINSIVPSDPVASFHPGPQGQQAIAAAIAAAVAPDFVDVVEGQAFYDDIRWLAESGLSTGTVVGDDVYFYPASAVSRQAMAAFMYRYAGAPYTPAPGQQTFDDVGPDNPFYVAIEWMAAEGLATGYEGGDLFGPARPVSRQAMGAFLYRLAGEPAVDASVTFPDVPADSEFADAIAWLGSTGVAEGYEDGTFGPAVAISRQAMAAFLHRFHGLAAV